MGTPEKKEYQPPSEKKTLYDTKKRAYTFGLSNISIFFCGYATTEDEQHVCIFVYKKIKIPAPLFATTKNVALFSFITCAIAEKK